MSQARKQLYVKFKMDKRRTLMRAFVMSENRDIVSNWKHDERKEDNSKKEEAEEELNPFNEISKEFEKSMEVFQQAIPFFLASFPMVVRFMDDVEIRGFIKRHGELIEEGEYETYKIDEMHFGHISRVLQDMHAKQSGLGALPDMFLVGLVSAYDVFLSQLIRWFFMTRPEIISSSERNISFKDLMEIGTVEAARERIIEKEIETVMRKSHVDQIVWLESKLERPLRKDLAVWPDFVELCERRNLLTHTGGVVSSQYLAVCREHKVGLDGRVVGQRLRVTAKYYRKAVESVFEFGCKLAQVVWRILKPNEIELAERRLNDLSYKLITRKEYRLSSEILRFGLVDMKKHGKEFTRKMMVVNYVNAEKLSGNKERATEILDREDWSATTDNYRICVAAVKDDIDTVTKLMKRVVDMDLLTKRDFREWPVFIFAREDAKFSEAFEHIFGERLLHGEEISSGDTIGSDLEIDLGSDHSDGESTDNGDAVDPTVH